MRKSVKGSLFWGIVSMFVILGCAPNRGSSNPTQAGQMASENQHGPRGANGLNESLVNIYLEGYQVNFQDSSIDTIRTILGSPTSSIKLGGNEQGEIYQDIFPDVTINYYKNSGRLLHFVIAGQTASIEFGARVGDSAKEIAKNYADGFFFAGEENQVYRYLTLTKGVGLGYSFHLEKDIVTSIEVGFVPLGK